jgi:hypothetical protein
VGPGARFATVATEIYGVVGTVLDVTEQRTLEEQSDQMFELVETTMPPW